MSYHKVSGTASKNRKLRVHTDGNKESLPTEYFLHLTVHIEVKSKFFFCLFAFSRAALVAYGDSQARDLIRAVATGLGQSHSKAGAELHLRPTPQLMAMPDP